MIPFFWVLAAFIASMIPHEIGHYLTAKAYGYRPVFVFHEGNPAVKIYGLKKGDTQITLAGSISQTIFMIPFLVFGQFDAFKTIGGPLIIIIGMVASWHFDYRHLLAKWWPRLEPFKTEPNELQLNLIRNRYRRRLS